MRTSNYHYGDNHIFTSRSPNPIINILPGAGETLNIQGASISGSLTETKTTDELLYKPALFNANIQYSPSVTNLNQGISVSAATSVEGDEWVIFGCPNEIVPPGTSTGGLAVFKNGVQSTLLSTSVITTNYEYGVNCNINKDGGTRICVNTGQDNHGAYGNRIDIFTRVTNTWTFQQTINNMTSCASYGNYLILGSQLDSAYIYFYGGSSFAAQQTLNPQTAGTATITLVAMGDSSTCAFVSNVEQLVRVYTRSGTSWGSNTVLDKFISDGAINSISMTSNTLCYNTNNNCYIAIKDAGVFKLNTVVPGNQIVSSCVMSDIYIYFSSASIITSLSNAFGYGFYITGTAAASLVSCIACSDKDIYTGQPTYASNVGRVSIYTQGSVAPPQTITTDSVSLGNQLELNSIYPIKSTSLNITGDLTVSGIIYGFPNATYTSIAGSNAQTIVVSTYVPLVGIYSVDSNTSAYLPVDFSIGGIICDTSGLYNVLGNVQWPSQALGTRQLVVYLNGSATSIITSNDSNTLGDLFQNVNGYLSMLSGDYVQLVVFQNSMSSIALTSAVFSVCKVANI